MSSFHRAGVPRIPNERKTKTRSGNDPQNVRSIAPKMFAVPNFKNHSGRKTMIQTLVNNDVPPIGHVRYKSNMAPRLSGQNCKFFKLFCLSIPKRDLDTKKTTPTIEV